MPKFYGQNKKRIDPRYFLKETINRDPVDAHGPADPSFQKQILKAPDGSPRFKPGPWKENQEILVGAPGDTPSSFGPTGQGRAIIRGVTDDGHLEIEWRQGSSRGTGRIDVIDPNETPVRLARGSSDADNDGTDDATELMRIAQAMQKSESPMAGTQPPVNPNPNVEDLPMDQRSKDQWGNVEVSPREREENVKAFQKYFREKTPPGGWSLKK